MVTCSDPPELIGAGRLAYKDEPYRCGDDAKYICMPSKQAYPLGYSLWYERNNKIVCGSLGLWEGLESVCHPPSEDEKQGLTESGLYSFALS